MVRRRRRISEDRELLELFRDDPGALAIADAIASTQQPPAHSTRNRRLVLAAAVVVAAAFVGLVVRNDSQAGVIEQALAAMPQDRVVHLVLEGGAAFTVVDLRTGTTIEVPHITEEWFDPRTGERRVREAIGPITTTDTRGRPAVLPATPAGYSDAALTAFPILYRQALRHASDNDVTSGTLDGMPVYWVRFRAGSRLQLVAIDRETFEVKRIVFRGRGGSLTLVVRRTDVLAKDQPVPAVDSVPRAVASPVLTSTLEPRESVAFETAKTTRVLGTAVNGLALRSFRSLRFANGDRGFDILYTGAGPITPSRGFLHVQESHRPELRFGWSLAVRRAAREGTVVVQQNGPRTLGYVTDQGLFITITTSEGVRTATALARRLTAR